MSAAPDDEAAGAAVVDGSGAGSTLGGSIRIDSRIFSASTSFSIVLRNSFEALRNSAIILPRLLPISGSFRGPKTMSATTKMRKSSGPPNVPNMCFRGILSPASLPRASPGIPGSIDTRGGGT